MLRKEMETYRTDALVIETQPSVLVEIFDVGIIVTARRASRMDHDAEQFVYVRSFGFRVYVGARANINTWR